MKGQVFKFLKNYSTQPIEVDRLIVSAYLVKNRLTVKKNKLLNDYFITIENNTEYENLSKFVEVVEK